jgi:hypothetical protein
MSLPYSDPSNPALPSPLFSDLTAVRADHLRANNAAIFADLSALDVRLLRMEELESTASSGGTLTLVAANKLQQLITGTLAHTIVLPVVTTLYVGFTFIIINDSTQNITINSSGSNLVKTLLPGRAVLVTCILITGSPASVAANEVPIFSDTTGKTLASSGQTIAQILAQTRESFGTIQNSAGTPNTVIDFGVGAHWSDDFSTWIADVAGMSKSSSSWAAGTGNGMLDTGSFAASTVYYLYRIWNPSTLAVDYLMSLSNSAPAMPSGFTKKRLIGAVLTDASTYFYAAKFSRPTPTLFRCDYTTPVNNRAQTTVGSLARQLITVSAPANAAVLMLFYLQVYYAQTGNIEYLRMGPTSDVDAAPTTTTADLRALDSIVVGVYGMASANLQAVADSNRQIYFRLYWSVASQVMISTKSWMLSL